MLSGGNTFPVQIAVYVNLSTILETNLVSLKEYHSV